MIDSKLAQELEKAGFPRLGVHFGAPGLSALMAACEAANKAGEFVLKKAVYDDGRCRWFAYFEADFGNDQKLGQGDAADESVARLWLALRETAR
jgi:hypothetical protein